MSVGETANTQLWHTICPSMAVALSRMKDAYITRSVGHAGFRRSASGTRSLTLAPDPARSEDNIETCTDSGANSLVAWGGWVRQHESQATTGLERRSHRRCRWSCRGSDRGRQPDYWSCRWRRRWHRHWRALGRYQESSEVTADLTGKSFSLCPHGSVMDECPLATL